MLAQILIEPILPEESVATKLLNIIELDVFFNKVIDLAKYVLVLILALTFSLSSVSYSAEKTSQRYGQTAEQQETLQWLWNKAQRFAGIESIYQTDSPQHLPVYILPASMMNQEICPDTPHHCANLGGAYDAEKKHILLRNDLAPDEDIISASFLLHEFAHALRNETLSVENIFRSCSSLRMTEQQAYNAQNAFLKSEGALFRAGIGLRMMVCPEDTIIIQPMLTP